MSSSLLSPSQASQVTLGGTISQWPSRKCIFTAFFSGTGVRAVRRITGKRAGRLCPAEVCTRVSHFYTFFELSLVLLTTQAHGL